MVRKGGLPCKRKEKERKRNKERGIEREEKVLDFLIRCSQENKIKGEDFWGNQNQKRDVDLGWIRVMVGKKISLPLFQLMAITLFTPYKLIFLKRPKKNITLHMYIYPYLCKTIFITLKDHRCFIISQ